ncbi:zliS Lysozyme family protein [uncultured Caudovirales phage]|uniref:ZliS Lysozyme family protein n=1 Tax=uncultured Caudovirales phage TaxID=2100421 RepID=A0A6J5LJ91_9CAUD|nr:zliS Lysozyme family protein [uncultured Caudovirales phage]
MVSDFDRAFVLVVGVEGGLSLDPKDPGNWTGGATDKGSMRGTKWGISAKAYPDLDILNLSIEQAKAIYRRDYWDKCSCDQLPTPLDVCVFDCAVNQGVGTAIRLLQDAVGTTVDGVIGPNTLARAAQARRETCAMFMVDRMFKYMTTPNFDRYGRGWFKRVLMVFRDA